MVIASNYPRNTENIIVIMRLPFNRLPVRYIHTEWAEYESLLV
jgi:hypothetical protein